VRSTALWHPRQLSVNKALLAGATASGSPKSPNQMAARRQTAERRTVPASRPLRTASRVPRKLLPIGGGELRNARKDSAEIEARRRDRPPPQNPARARRLCGSEWASIAAGELARGLTFAQSHDNSPPTPERSQIAPPRARHGRDRSR